MPLTNLGTTLQQSNQAFSQKLEEVKGYANSILQAESRKKQLADQARKEKDIIDYRYERKEQYQRDVVGPQQQAEAFQEQLQDSFKNAKQQKKDWQSLLQREGSADMGAFGLDNFEVAVEQVTTNDGKLAGYDAKVYLQGPEGYTEIDESFTTEFNDRRAMADELSSVFNSNDEIKSSQNLSGADLSRPQALVVGNDKEGQEFKRKMRADPQFREEMVGAWKNGNLVIGRQDPEPEGGSGGGGRQVPKNDVVLHLDKLQDFWGGENKLTVGFNENVIDTWSPFDKNELPTGGVVDKNSSVGNIYDQINMTFRMVLPPDLSKKFEGVGSLSEGEREIIMSGNTEVEGFDKLPETRQQIVETLANYSEDTRQKLGKFIQLRGTYEALENEYKRVTGKTFDEYNMMLNPNIPEQIDTQNPFEDVFIKVSNDKGKLTDQMKYYNRDSDVQASFEYTQK